MGLHLPNLSRAFPVPKYLRPSGLGLDISDRSLKFAELFSKEGHLELGAFGSKIIPDGVISSGEVKDKGALTRLLEGDLGEFKEHEIILSLPEEKAFVGLVTLPLMPSENIHEALELQLEEHVPLSAKEAIFDYELIPSAEAKDHLDAVLVAFPRNLVEDYRDAVKAAGLKPFVFEMETQALVRSILPKGEEETV